MRQSGATGVTYEFDVLLRAWSLAGRRLGQPNSHGCVIAGCQSLAFVALKISAGNRSVCFRHYTLLDQSSDLAD